MVCWPAREREAAADDARRFPDEKLTRAQALKGMTYDAAYASFSEDRLGSLTPGKKADFVVLDRDIMTVPQEEILKTKVVSTVRRPVSLVRQRHSDESVPGHRRPDRIRETPVEMKKECASMHI
jgi:cytosine/adenosine deaminase-related metal-dependent hydrolase